jgi:dipeptidase E
LNKSIAFPIPPQTKMVQIVCTGKGASMALPKVISQVQLLAQTNTPSVLYLGTPSYDRDDVFEIQTKGFRDRQWKINKLDLSELPYSQAATRQITYPTTEEMKLMVDEADVIQVSGGNTLYAMKRWQEMGMADILRAAAIKEKGPVFCGGSAGAICWFEKGNSDSMNPTTFLNPDESLTEEQKLDWDYICIDGLNILRGLCVPHYDTIQHNGLHRSKASEAMLMQFPDYPCIGIDETAALVVDGDVVRVMEGDHGAKVYRKFYCSKSNQVQVMALEEHHGDYSLTEFGLTH